MKYAKYKFKVGDRVIWSSNKGMNGTILSRSHQYANSNLYNVYVVLWDPANQYVGSLKNLVDESSILIDEVYLKMVNRENTINEILK